MLWFLCFMLGGFIALYLNDRNDNDKKEIKDDHFWFDADDDNKDYSSVEMKC